MLVDSKHVLAVLWGPRFHHHRAVNGTLVPYRVKNAQTGDTLTLQLFNTRPANRLATATSGTKILENSDNFRLMWLANLYSRRPEVGTSPSLAFSTMPDEPEPTEPGCGTTRECVEIY
jgi:hypothetical protein